MFTWSVAVTVMDGDGAAFVLMSVDNIGFAVGGSSLFGSGLEIV